MACSDALWNTVLKLMWLQRKALHQTSMHCDCRFVMKLGRATRGGDRRMASLKYATCCGITHVPTILFCLYPCSMHVNSACQVTDWLFCRSFSGRPEWRWRRSRLSGFLVKWRSEWHRCSRWTTKQAARYDVKLLITGMSSWIKSIILLPQMVKFLFILP